MKIFLQKLWMILFLGLMIGCSNQNPRTKGIPKQVVHHEQYPIEVYDYENLKKEFFNRHDDTLRIINFWATWCKPCVEELPFLEHITESYPKVKVTLVSLDFPKHIDTKLVNYLIANKIKSKVVVLDDDDANTWINDVDKQWSGAIPATIIYKKNKKHFYEKSFKKEELINIVESFK